MGPEKELESLPGYTYTARIITQLGEAVSSCARRNSLLESILPEGSSEVTAVYSLAEMAYIHKEAIIQKLHLVMR